MTRDVTSRPISSVPNRCAALGALRTSLHDVCKRIVRRDRRREYGKHDKEHDNAKPEHGAAPALKPSQHTLSRRELAQGRSAATANLESGRNLSRQSFVDSYNKQEAAEPRVDPLNRIASALAGRPASPYNANPSNYRQLTPSEEAEKYRSEQSEYAGLAAGVATPELASATGLARFAPGPNQLNMFLPARDSQKAEALTLEQQGVHPDNILKQTGAFRDVDGRWIREISDASSRITPEAQQFIKDYQSAAGPATDIFEHPELYKQAPGLKKYQIELEQEPEFITSAHPDYFTGFQQKAEAMEQRGYSPKEIFKQSNMVRSPKGEWTQRYFPLGWHSGEEKNIRVAGANPEDFRKVVLHESSHAVDKAMGRPSYGASDDRIYQDIANLPKEEVIARAQASHAAGSPWAPNLDNYKDNWEGFLRQQASDEYMRNAAEARARNVRTRRNMSEAERLNTHPFKTMDVPPEQQIVGYPPGKKHGGSISDKTYALLHRIKRQDGGQVPLDTEEPLYDPNPIPSHYSIPKERLQPDDPNLGSFRALGGAFHYTVPPDASESNNVEDRRYTHPSLPTSDFGNYSGPTLAATRLALQLSPPSSAAGVQGMAGTPSGPSATRATLEPWKTTNMAPITSPAEPSWTPPPVKALLQPSMLRNFNSYAPEFGSERASFDPLMQPSLARGGTVSRPSLRQWWQHRR